MAATKEEKAGTPPLGQVEIAGLKESALNPAQKKALEALANLAAHREKAKAERATLKDEGERLELLAFEALDAIGLRSGPLGGIAFEDKVVRKLKVKILKARSRKAKAKKPAPAKKAAAS